MDGFNYNSRASICIKIITSDQRTYEHSIELHSVASNNVVEYEATIHGSKLVRALGALVVKLCIDSWSLDIQLGSLQQRNLR